MSTVNGFAQMFMILVGGTSILLAPHALATGRDNVSDAPQSSCLVLEWMDPHQLLPTGERWTAKETSRILDGAKIPTRWDWSRGNDGDRSPATGEHRLRVVLVPSAPSGPGWRLAANTLGATVRDGKTAPPAVYIFYHSIVSVLGRGLSKHGRDPRVSDPHFLGRASRALGRVIAHEIAHALAPGEPHSSSGLMQAGLGTKLLTARQKVTIDDEWRRVLTTGLAQLCSEH